MELVTLWETMYGYTYPYKFFDEQGNVLVWFASKVIDDCKAIKSTVKSHVERDGVKQTIITICGSSRKRAAPFFKSTYRKIRDFKIS